MRTMRNGHTMRRGQTTKAPSFHRSLKAFSLPVIDFFFWMLLLPKLFFFFLLLFYKSSTYVMPHTSTSCPGTKCAALSVMPASFALAKMKVETNYKNAYQAPTTRWTTRGTLAKHALASRLPCQNGPWAAWSLVAPAHNALHWVHTFVICKRVNNGTKPVSAHSPAAQHCSPPFCPSSFAPLARCPTTPYY